MSPLESAAGGSYWGEGVDALVRGVGFGIQVFKFSSLFQCFGHRLGIESYKIHEINLIQLILNEHNDCIK